MEITRICKECRQPLPADAPEGLCPACLASVALGTEPAAGSTLKLNLTDAADEASGQTLGRYKLLEKLGEGGCGVVYVAAQTEPVRRRVALKIIKLGMDTKQVIARFEAERQALALMDHPNIAKIFDAGATGTGRPYFVMELVKGVPITRYCDENNLSTATRLGLFIQVCQAIQHAHQKGIIHRDIKPSNVLVADHDGVPVPKIIDFGIAKATTDQPLTDKTLFTAFEQFIGTPAYMSPEQARLSGLDIDTRSDIYSLGVLLYELLTGKTPFEGKRLHEAGLDEIRRIIREEEPARPSTRLHTLDAAEQTTVAKHRQSDPPKLAHLISGDLDWIVMKALEKDRARRYETANGLAMDIQRHLHNEPVAARPPSSFYRVQRMVRRNKLAFTTAGIVAAALIAGLGLSTWSFLRERQAHDHERRLLYGANMNLAQQAWEQNNISRLGQLLEETRAFPDRGFEWYYWERQTHFFLKTLCGNVQGSLNSAAFSPDGSRVVTGGYANTAKVWDAASGRELLNLAGHTNYITSVAFFPDGRRILTGSYDGTARVWDAASGKELLAFKGHTGQVFSTAISQDGQRVVTGSADNTAKVWETASGRELLTIKWAWVTSLAFSPDGRQIATGCLNWGSAKVWDAESGRELFSLTGSSVAFSPDSRWIVTGGYDGTVKLWDAASGKEVLTLNGRHSERINSVAFSPDSRRIISGSEDRTAKVWDAANGKALLTLKGHEAAIQSAAFSPDGRRFVTASFDGTARIWDDASNPEPLTLNTGPMIAMSFSPDSQRIITGADNQTTAVWDAASGKKLLALKEPGGRIKAIAFSLDGQRIVTGSEDRSARVWDTASGKDLLALKGHEAAIYSAAFSPDGRKIVTGSADNTAKLWDAASGQELLTLKGHTGIISSVAFSSDGQRVVTGSWDWTAKVWDVKSGRELLTLNELKTLKSYQNLTPIMFVAFSPDGGRVVTVNWDKTAKVWDLAGRRIVVTLKGHNGNVLSAAFSPDGRRIVTGSVDTTARLWDAASGRELLTFKGNGGVCSVAFAPDGQRIVTGSYDGTARVWEAARMEQVARWQAEEDEAEPHHLVKHGLNWSWN